MNEERKVNKPTLRLKMAGNETVVAARTDEEAMAAKLLGLNYTLEAPKPNIGLKLKVAQNGTLTILAETNAAARMAVMAGPNFNYSFA